MDTHGPTEPSPNRVIAQRNFAVSNANVTELKEAFANFQHILGF